MDAAQTLADVAAAYLLNAQAREEARETSDRFHHNALHDPLTGLPNRLMLQHRLEHAAQRAQRSNTNAADPVRRPRPVQAGQRHPRPPGRRRAAARGRATALRSGPARRHPGPGLGRRVRLPVRGPAQRRRRRGPRPAHRRGVRPPVRARARSSSRSRPASASRSPVRARTSPNQLVVEADTAMYQAKRKGGAGHQIIDLREAVRDQRRRQPGDGPARRARQRTSSSVAYQPIVRSARRAGHRRRGAAALEPPAPGAQSRRSSIVARRGAERT